MNFSGYGGCITEADTVRPPVLSVLLVDDEPCLLNVCKRFLEMRPDISVSIASSVEYALQILESTTFDVIVSDYQMPGTDGIGFLKILTKKHSSVPFILFTCRDQKDVMAGALDCSTLFYLQKGGNPRSLFTELEGKIREVCRLYKAEGALHETRHVS